MSSNLVSITILGTCRLTVRGNGTARVDNLEPASISGESQFDVTTRATLDVDAQVLAFFPGKGVFVADGIRVVADGVCTVNMLKDETHCGGAGIVYAEGCRVRADNQQTVMAVNCSHVDSHDDATLLAAGCESVAVYDRSTAHVANCQTVQVVDEGTLNARDCKEVRVDEGFDDWRPTTNLVDCGTPVAVHQDFDFDDELCTHEVYVS